MPKRLLLTQFTAECADPDQMAEHYGRTLAFVEVEPLQSRGRIDVRDQHFRVGPSSVWRGACPSGMHVSFSAEDADAIIVYVPINGHLEAKSGSRRFLSSPGEALVVELGEIDSLTLQPGRGHTGLALHKQLLLDQLSRSCGRQVGTLGIRSSFGLSSDHGQRVHRLTNFIWNNLQTGSDSPTAPLFFDQLISALGVLILDTSEHLQKAPPNSVSPALPRHLKRAIDYMQANIAARITIGELAELAGVSARALQDAFQRYRGISPLHYHRNLKLMKVREELLSSGPSVNVGVIARKWGFSHMGRFARAYMEMFGEAPSDRPVR